MRNLKPLILFCSVYPGAEYNDTIKSARRLSKLHNLTVDFKFNDRAVQVDASGKVFDSDGTAESVGL